MGWGFEDFERNFGYPCFVAEEKEKKSGNTGRSPGGKKYICIIIASKLQITSGVIGQTENTKTEGGWLIDMKMVNYIRRRTCLFYISR